MSDSVKTTQVFTATGAGADQFYGLARSVHKLTCILGGTVAPTAAKVRLEQSDDEGTTWKALPLVWDTAAGQVSGDHVEIAALPCTRIRPYLQTLTGGTAPTVTTKVISSDE